MSGVFWVALGGAIGSAARHGVNVGSARFLGEGFPWGTFIVNIAGSFLMGLIMAFLAKKMADHENARLFLTVGVLGGFTTFSAFSLDVFNLVQRGENSTAAVYVLASVVVSIAAVFAGFWVLRVLA